MYSIKTQYQNCDLFQFFIIIFNSFYMHFSYVHSYMLTAPDEPLRKVYETTRETMLCFRKPISCFFLKAGVGAAL